MVYNYRPLSFYIIGGKNNEFVIYDKRNSPY